MRRPALLAPLVAALLGPSLAAPAAVPTDPWDAWPGTRVSPSGGVYRPADLQAALAALVERHPDLLSVERRAASSEGRPILLLRAGTGPLKVFLWSQMHGDEPTATGALVDLLEHLGRTRGTPATDSILARLTLLVLPMLNPDGAERFDRRNAQGIDINRDALRLATPEGRFLKEVRDTYTPSVGFNLHNQSPMMAAGPDGLQVALSVLAVAADPEVRETPGRLLQKRLAVVADRAAAAHLPGRVARYDTDYTERAFGDSLGRWGTPVLLLETGGLTDMDGFDTLVRLNVSVLFAALQALADGSVATVDAAAYESIPLNTRDRIVDLVVRGGRLAGGRGLPLFTADVALGVPRGASPDPTRRSRLVVTDVGDLSTLRGLEEIDARGLLVAPAAAGGADGWKRTLEGLSARGLAGADGRLRLDPDGLGREAAAWTGGKAIVPGYDGALLLLRPDGDGWLRLERTVTLGAAPGAPRAEPRPPKP